MPRLSPINMLLLNIMFFTLSALLIHTVLPAVSQLSLIKMGNFYLKHALTVLHVFRQCLYLNTTATTTLGMLVLFQINLI